MAHLRPALEHCGNLLRVPGRQAAGWACCAWQCAAQVSVALSAPEPLAQVPCLAAEKHTRLKPERWHRHWCTLVELLIKVMVFCGYMPGTPVSITFYCIFHLDTKSNPEPFINGQHIGKFPNTLGPARAARRVRSCALRASLSAAICRL